MYVRSSGHLSGFGYQGIGLGLQFSAAALLDVARALGQSSEEGIHPFAHLGCGTKTDICRQFLTNPGPDPFNRTNRLLPQ
jgi:hypothetical protein